ncbi:MAG: hypothetical protein OHK0023_26650 [Anaerolineae bacterium]
MGDTQTHAVFASDLEICYEVLLYLSSRLAKLAAGEVLEYITGDAEAEGKIVAWSEQRDITLLAHERLADGRWRFLLQKPKGF